jgi:hypothetical protein
MVFTLAGLLLRSGLFMPDAALSTTNRAWWQGERARLSLVPGAAIESAGGVKGLEASLGLTQLPIVLVG